MTARVKAALTSRNHYEEKVEITERYRQLVENASEGIVIIQEGMLRFCNPKTLEITGFSEEELTNRAFVELLQPQDQRNVLGYFGNPLDIQQETTTHAFRIVAKDGNIKWLETNTVSIIWEDKSAWLIFLTDITERKRAEKEKETIQKQLLQAQKMEAVGTLAGGIAHDFNNLLQIVQGYADLLIHSMNHDERQYLALQNIIGATKRGAELTRQLVTFSRTAESHRLPLDLNQKVQNVKELLGRTIPKMIDIELQLTDDLRFVHADPTHVEQMVMNLVVNAKDAMLDGGKLIIKTENVILNEEFCRIHPDANPWMYALLTVADNGHGIDKETLDHIFEPFYTTKEVGKGTGLGLAMVYGIVKSHRGFVSCSSQPGEGTTFKVYLPTVEQEVARVEEKKTKASVQGGKERILLVDDEEIIRDLGVQILGEFGYAVLTAPNGESALELYRNKPNEIDLVILDLFMPGMGGMRCLEELLKINPHVRIIISSGYVVNGSTEKTIEERTRGYISKPFDREQILSLIREALDVS